MRLSKSLCAAAVLTCFSAQAEDPLPMPTDIPYSIGIVSGSFVDSRGIEWSADAGAVINSAGLVVLGQTIDKMETDNRAMAASIVKQNKELADAQAGASAGTYASIAASIIGTIATVVAVGLAAKK